MIVNVEPTQIVRVRPHFFTSGSISRTPGPIGESAIIWKVAWMAARPPYWLPRTTQPQ